MDSDRLGALERTVARVLRGRGLEEAVGRSERDAALGATCSASRIATAIAVPRSVQAARPALSSTPASLGVLAPGPSAELERHVRDAICGMQIDARRFSDVCVTRGLTDEQTSIDTYVCTFCID